MRHSLDPEVDPRAHIFPVNDVFETRDGKRLTLGILEEHFWDNFKRCVPGFDVPEFSTDGMRRANGDVLSTLLSRAMREKDADEWIRLLEENDVPVDLCVTPAQAANHPQLRERAAASAGHALFPVWANGRRGGSLRRGVPKLGEHTREILVELGFDDAEVADLIKSRTVKAG
jgi:crotonobetainyl-CoA:carnitine CoA-transferase CaiB-like acyl-CoA transferase